jgi:uncharacterized protein (DUF2062 family)
MQKESILAKIKRFIIVKFFKINDSPQRIALGVGLGVFAGLLPGTGPVAALFLAFIFRANRAAAALGGLLTNTWISLLTFILAIKIGSAILRMDWHIVQEKAQGLIQSFSWQKFFKLSLLDVLLPLVTGYLIIGLVLGALAYWSALSLLKSRLGRRLTEIK